MLETLSAILLAAVAAPLLVRSSRRAAPWVLAAVAPLSVTYLGLRAHSAGPTPLTASLTWVPALGADLALRLDSLALLMALLIGWIGGFVTLHAGSYLRGHPQLGRFYFLLLTFLAAMLGLVLADNLLLLFVCWELTSITSYFLIGFKHQEMYARAAAQRALVTTGAGGLALLGGLVLLVMIGERAGLDPGAAATLSTLFEHGAALRADPLYPATLILIFIGCFTKSAQVPFHHWLPQAMAGPTPVSALLHSATMVKAGIYLLARLHPALGGTPLWMAVLTTGGALTMVTGAVLAVGQRDLKALLAYTTVSALGTLTLLLGIGSDQALAAFVVFLTVHALYKSSLFLAIGNVDQQAGSRDLAHLRGLRRAMPVTAAAALLAAVGKAGAPPALGYLGKKIALQAKLQFAAVSEWLMLAAVLTNVLMVAASLAVAWRPFWGPLRKLDRPIREAAPPMLLGPAVLAAAGIAVGIVPALFERPLGEGAAAAIAGRPVAIELKLWSGLSLEALLLIATSLAAFLLGYGVYRRLDTIWRLPPLPAPLVRLCPTVLHDRGLAALDRLARTHTRIVQSGRLRIYVGLTALAATAAVGPWVLRALQGSGAAASHAWPVQMHDVLLLLLIAAGAAGALAAQRPIVAVLAAGVPGLALALVFARFGGIDLAITQLLVETLLVVLLAAVLHRFARRMRPCRFGWRVWLPAGLGGGLVAGIVLAAAAVQRSPHVADAMLARAGPAAFGRNVVNVILVDFRALDTLGEITVVLAAAVGLGALLRARGGRP